jgi:predicted component of type VI protein secretion system
MGRTVIPYSMKIDLVISRFEQFRKGLRRVDREKFDELMRAAKMQVQAGVMAQHPNAFDSISMAIHLELKKEIDDLACRLSRIEKTLENKPEPHTAT